MNNLACIILAAGKGTRMKSPLPKVLHCLAGFPLVGYALRNCQKLEVSPIILITNKQQKNLDQVLNKFSFPPYQIAIQDPPLGTGHAVMVGMNQLKNFEGDVLILYGDVPLIQEKTLEALTELHRTQKADLTFATAQIEGPSAYGRILRDIHGNLVKIIEVCDATEGQLKIKEVNVGLYLAKASFLREALSQINNKNDQQEYYLTDLIQIAAQQKYPTAILNLEDYYEWQGVNTQLELSQLETIRLKQHLDSLLQQGIRVIHPETIYIEEDVEVGFGSTLWGPLYLLGQTRIGEKCTLEPGCMVFDSIIDNEVTLKAYSYIEKSHIQDQAQIGPFAHLRPESVVGAQSKVGNFVELKKTTLGKKTKASHLSYLGDAVIGNNVNIGAGTITCNYDGTHKNTTILEDDVFVGSDTQFVAPVKIGKGSYIGAGSTITKNVTPKSLALSRVPQHEIKDWTLGVKPK